MAQHGAFVWNELQPADTARAREFYTALLDWGTKDPAADDPMQHTEFQNRGESIAGLITLAESAE